MLGAPVTEVRELADVEKVLAFLNERQASFHEVSVQTFLSCSNRKLFDEKKKTAKSRPTCTSSSSVTELALDSLTVKSKSIKNQLIEALGLQEEVCGLLEQLSKKIGKLGECFSKLRTDWTSVDQLEKIIGKANPLPSILSDLKIACFEWSNSIDKNRIGLQKSIGAAEVCLRSAKELHKNLKVRREAVEPQRKLADEISLVQLTRSVESCEEISNAWLEALKAAGSSNTAMEKIRLAARKDEVSINPPRSRLKSENFT